MRLFVYQAPSTAPQPPSEENMKRPPFAILGAFAVRRYCGLLGRGT